MLQTTDVLKVNQEQLNRLHAASQGNGPVSLNLGGRSYLAFPEGISPAIPHKDSETFKVELRPEETSQLPNADQPKN